MDTERYRPKPDQRVPSDPTEVTNARAQFITAVEGDPSQPADFDGAVDAISKLIKMDEAAKPAVLVKIRQLGKNDSWRTDIRANLVTARIAGDWERVQDLVRMAHYMGMTGDPENPIIEAYMRVFGKLPTLDDAPFKQVYDEAEQELERQKQVAAAQAAAAASTPTAGPTTPPPPPHQPGPTTSGATSTGPTSTGSTSTGTTSTVGGTGPSRPAGSGAGPRSNPAGTTGSRTSGPTSRPTGPAAGPTNPNTAPSTPRSGTRPAWEIFDTRMIDSLEEEIKIAQRTEDPDTHKPIEPVSRDKFIKRAEAKKKTYNDEKLQFEAEWAQIEARLQPGIDPVDEAKIRYVAAFEIMRAFASSNQSDKTIGMAAAQAVLFPKIWPNERARRGFMGASAGNGIFGIFHDEILGLLTYLPRQTHDYVFDPLLLEPNYAGTATKLKIPTTDLRAISTFKRLLFNRYHPDLYPDQIEQQAMRTIYDRFNHYWEALKPYIEEIP